MCEITAVASKDAPQYWLKCSVSGQRHRTIPSMLYRVCHPQRPRWATPPHPPRQQICQASRPFAWYSQPGLVKQEADSWQEVKTPAICQRGTRVKMSGPGTFPRAAGLLAKETRRMVEAGACCHRRDKLPKTGDQELLLPLFIRDYFPSMSTDIYLAADFFHCSSLGPFHLTLSSSVFIWILQSVTFSLLLIIHRLISQSFLIPPPPPHKMKMKWSLPPVHAMFFHNFQIQYGKTKKLVRTGGKINKCALRFSQSLPACCCF